MNAAVMAAPQSAAVVELLSMCPHCANPFSAIEKGLALLSMSTEAAAGASDMQLSPNGVVLQGVDEEGILKFNALGQPNQVRLQLVGSSTASQYITPGAYLRLYLWPLTAWDLSNGTISCECEASSSSEVCGPSIDCLSESVVDDVNGAHNIMRYISPANMDPITDTIKHKLLVSGLMLPS